MLFKMPVTMNSTNTNHNNNIVFPNKTVSEHESGYFEECDEQSTSMDKGSSLVRSSQNENNNNNNCDDKGKFQTIYTLFSSIETFFS